MNGFGSWLFGLLGGICAWFATEFAAKPLTRFFELRAEVRRQMIIFANVRARWQEDIRGHTKPLGGDAKLSEDDERRLKQAEEAYRELGARMAAFSDTQIRPLVWLLQKLGYDPRLAGSSLIGLSNSIGTYGKNRHDKTKAVETALRINRK